MLQTLNNNLLNSNTIWIISIRTNTGAYNFGQLLKGTFVFMIILITLYKNKLFQIFCILIKLQKILKLV